MKNIFSLLFCMLLGTCVLMAQPYNFEGEIHFKVEYLDFPGNTVKLKDKLPKSLHIYIRKNLVCRQSTTALENGYMIEIINLSKKQGYLGWKYNKGSAYKKTESYEIANDYLGLPKPVNIEYLNETKNFGGYVGKKALVFMDNNNEPFTVYYTDEISKEAFSIYQDLNGFPLYYEGSMNGITFKAYATSVSPKPQPDARFIMPSEYKLLGKEEFKLFILAN